MSRRPIPRPVMLATLVFLALGPSPAGSVLADDADTSWLTRVQQGLAEREYEASRNSEGLQAPNRRHDLRTYFGAERIRVHDRTAAGSPALLSLSLSGVGRGEKLEAVAPGTVVSEGTRVEIRRPGLVEWYINSETGLEQGFTLRERPAGQGALTLELSIEKARASLRGGRALFETATGRRLEYGKLQVVDSQGRTLAAQLEVPDAGRLRIVLEDGDAIYPVTIDPLLTSVPDTQLESDQINAYLGTSVSDAGDVNGDGYGDVIVGADRYDAGESQEGAAFVFLGSASGIADGTPSTAAAQLESNQVSAFFGHSVSGAGDVNDDGFADVIVGAQSYNSEKGGAFVFLGSASGIADGSPATAATRLGGEIFREYFGWSVSGAGDVNNDGYADVIVGAQDFERNLSLNNEGGAFVFLGSASGIADSSSAMAATQLVGGQVTAIFGSSVSGAGDVNGDGYADVIVGARGYDEGEDDEGGAFVFLGSDSGIADGSAATAAAKIQSDQAYAVMGWSVSGAGDVNDDGFADVIVGAPYYNAGESKEGGAFVFLGSASGIADGSPANAAAQLESDQTFAEFATSVSGAGDVNGDGYSDVIVGAPYYDAGQNSEGAAFVFLGSASGIANGSPATAAAQLELDQAGAALGISVSGAGDVNGDQVADVIVGARGYNAGQGDEGAAFVYWGSVPEPSLLLVESTALLTMLGLLRLRRQRRRCTTGYEP